MGDDKWPINQTINKFEKYLVLYLFISSKLFFSNISFASEICQTKNKTCKKCVTPYVFIYHNKVFKYDVRHFWNSSVHIQIKRIIYQTK